MDLLHPDLFFRTFCSLTFSTPDLPLPDLSFPDLLRLDLSRPDVLKGVAIADKLWGKLGELGFISRCLNSGMPEKRLIPASSFFRLVNCVSVRHRHSGIRNSPVPLVTDQSGIAQLWQQQKRSPVPLRFYLVSLSVHRAVRGIFRFFVFVWWDPAICGFNPRHSEASSLHCRLPLSRGL